MKYLFVLNDPPYGTERSYNALRLANNLLKVDEGVDLSLFLMADAVLCAKAGQKTPDGYYNIERMLKPVARKGRVLLCGSCMDARGIGDEELVEGCRRSSMNELTDLTIKADKVLIF
ncbi:MAG: DsrE family protein [Armatimonadetes bacterium]|nr:DsrE family protein [Armatimonadota bacterium]